LPLRAGYGSLIFVSVNRASLLVCVSCKHSQVT
jgi:ribosome-binding protein aMBF1 (putative translation factor)